ncbi:hypothetical protein ACFLWH_00860 [Chloroflexota bacterium]
MVARERGLTTGTMHYLALREGLAGRIRRKKIKDAELIRKLIGFYDEAPERKKRGITN